MSPLLLLFIISSSVLSFVNPDFDTRSYPEHAWEQLAPSTEDNWLRSLEEGDEQLTEVFQQDLDENAGLLCNKEPSVRAHAHYESAANK